MEYSQGMKPTLITLITMVLAAAVSAQTPKTAQPDQDAIIKSLTERVDSLEKKLDESQQETMELIAIERMAHDAGVIAPPEYDDQYFDAFHHRPYYYPRYYSRSYLRYYLSPFRGSRTYRHYHP